MPEQTQPASFGDESRMAVIGTNNAEMECGACGWLGPEDAATQMTGSGPTDFVYRCPHCGSPSIRDYESNLYKAGYR